MTDRRPQLVSLIEKAEERARHLQGDPSASADDKQRAFVRLGELRAEYERLDRDAKETPLSVQQQAQDTRAQKCLELRKRLAELEGQANVAAEVEVLQEQLEPEWAQLSKEARRWVNKNARQTR
jgi:hypothetical protein